MLADILRKIFIENFTFHELRKVSGVCRLWFQVSHSEPVGRFFMAQEGLEYNESWYETLSRPRVFILVDGSLSMTDSKSEYWRFGAALLKAKEVFETLPGCVEVGNVNFGCFAQFVTSRSIRKIEQIDEVASSDDVREMIGRKSIWKNTYSFITTIHQSSIRKTVVYIISDFEDSNRVIDMPGFDSPLHVHLYRIGNGRNALKKRKTEVNITLEHFPNRPAELEAMDLSDDENNVPPTQVIEEW